MIPDRILAFSFADVQARPHRVSRVTLPQEDLITRLVEHIENKHSSWVLSKSHWLWGAQPVSPCQWFGVYCDSEQRVARLIWDYSALCFELKHAALRGNLSWGYVPESVVDIYLENHRTLQGSCSFDALPQGLLTLQIFVNKFSGEINLTSLPPKLVSLLAWRNLFTGHADLTHLPPNVQRINLTGNALKGLIDLTKLPSRLTHLSLRDNYFDTVILSPETCDTAIRLSGNRILRTTGTIFSNVNIDHQEADDVEIPRFPPHHPGNALEQMRKETDVW